MATNNKDFAMELGNDVILRFIDGKLSLDVYDSRWMDWYVEELTPETAREMKSLIDMYLYSLYVKEAGI